MSPQEAVERLNTILAHAWMIRTFLKHADEIQEDEELLDVPRTLFDSIRAAEPARERGDTAQFLHRLKGKLPKIRRAAELFHREYKRASKTVLVKHPNYRKRTWDWTSNAPEDQALIKAMQGKSIPSIDRIEMYPID